MAKNRTRERSRPERIEAAERALRRLDRAIAAIDTGDELGVDELMAPVRLLVGKGDGLLARIARDVPPERHPTVHPVTAPVNAASAVTLALGAMPLADNVEPADGVAPRSLNRLMEMRCVAVGDMVNDWFETITWSQLISLVGNKDVLHLDDRAAVALDELRAYQLLDQPAVALALRNLAVVVSRYGWELLDELQMDTGQQQHHTIPAGNSSGWMGEVVVRDTRRPVPRRHPGASIDPAPKRTPQRAEPTPGRNDPCHCGSGRKYKRCCLD